MEQAEIRVGQYSTDGVFLGQIVRFTGEEVGSYREKHGNDTRYTIWTLYKVPENRYRIIEEYVTRWQGESSYTNLHPTEPEYDPDEDPEYAQPITYSTYSEEEARAAYPFLFAAIGLPNVVDLT